VHEKWAPCERIPSCQTIRNCKSALSKSNAARIWQDYRARFQVVVKTYQRRSDFSISVQSYQIWRQKQVSWHRHFKHL